MILPWVKDFLSFTQAPVTWTLLALNFIIYLFAHSGNFDGTLSDKDKDFYEQQGQVYGQFVLTHPEFAYDELTRKIARRVVDGSNKEAALFGGISLRDTNFLNRALQEQFSGDQVQLESWRKRFSLKVLDRQINPSINWGVSDEHNELWNWVSYQFSHGNGIHLLSNMLFLLVLGFFLEPMLGSLGLLCLYLSSGIAGALSYNFLTGVSGAPLVGASGAVCGLLGFATLYTQGQNAKFWFWLLPAPGYTGYVYLPFWTLFGYWLVSDLAGMIAAVEPFGGIAHTAHLGGLACGLLWALLLKISSLCRETGRRWKADRQTA